MAGQVLLILDSSVSSNMNLSPYVLSSLLVVISSISLVMFPLGVNKTEQLYSITSSNFSSIIILVSFLKLLSIVESISSFLVINSIPILLPNVAGFKIRGYFNSSICLNSSSFLLR